MRFKCCWEWVYMLSGQLIQSQCLFCNLINYIESFPKLCVFCQIFTKSITGIKIKNAYQYLHFKTLLFGMYYDGMLIPHTCNSFT